MRCDFSRQPVYEQINDTESKINKELISLIALIDSNVEENSHVTLNEIDFTHSHELMTTTMTTVIYSRYTR
jgi:hypothetical protein